MREGYAPRAPEDSVRPRHCSGGIVRPLNFTVRRHPWGTTMTFDAPAPAQLLSRPRYWATAATVAAVLGVLLIAVWPREVPKSDIRVRNASDVTLRDVVVGRTHYGDIAAGESTPYQSWGPAYPHPRVEFEAGGTRLQQIPVDHFGEHILGAGRFTYVITLAAPKSAADFSVEVAKD